VAKKARLIRPPDELKRRAVSNSKGLSLDLTPQEVARLETAVHRSKNRFVSQVAERLKALRVTHAGAERNPFTRESYLRQLRDDALAIKGLGGTYGFPLVTGLATSLDDFVRRLQDVNDKQMLVISLHIDTLYVLLAQQTQTLRPDTEGELLASLRILTARFG
jgi:hypothetical protein